MCERTRSEDMSPASSRTHFVFLLFISIVRLSLGRPSIRLMAFLIVHAMISRLLQ